MKSLEQRCGLHVVVLDVASCEVDEICSLLAAQVVQNSKGHVVRVPLIGELLSEQVASSTRCCRSKVC